MGLITVKSALKPKPDGGNEVAFYERDSRHPDGEVYVAGPGEVQIYETGAAHRAIERKRLKKVGEVASPQAEEEEEPASDRATRETALGKMNKADLREIAGASEDDERTKAELVADILDQEFPEG
jgi:hypothetical protein